MSYLQHWFEIGDIKDIYDYRKDSNDDSNKKDQKKWKVKIIKQWHKENSKPTAPALNATNQSLKRNLHEVLQ